jgi:hypothetical protein
LGPALKDCGVDLSPGEVDVIFNLSDDNDDPGLDLEEFYFAAKTPTKVQQWADTLQLSRVFARCLMMRNRNLEDPVAGVADLSSADLADVIDVFCRGLRRILADGQSELKKCLAAMQASNSATDGASSKFQTFKMSSGAVDDFHRGVTERVGEFPYGGDG